MFHFRIELPLLHCMFLFLSWFFCSDIQTRNYRRMKNGKKGPRAKRNTKSTMNLDKKKGITRKKMTRLLYSINLIGLNDTTFQKREKKYTLSTFYNDKWFNLNIPTQMHWRKKCFVHFMLATSSLAISIRRFAQYSHKLCNPYTKSTSYSKNPVMKNWAQLCRIE